jgi:hypothetical protein
VAGPSRKLTVTWAILLVACVCMPAGAAVASPKSYAPTRFDDPAPNGCKPNDCSLREAVIAANHHDGPDNIALSKGHYRLSIPENNSDDAEGGDLDVFDFVTIVGKGPAKTKVDAQGAFGVFTFLGFDEHQLEHLTVEGGARDDGAGIFVGPSPLVGIDLDVRDNTATGDGGGIYTVGTPFTLHNSTVEGNSAARGGGIYIPAGFVATPKFKLSSSTVSGNMATTGAGVYNNGANEFGNAMPAKLDVHNSTIAGNEATGAGGGVITSSSAQTTLLSTTVARNIADSSGAGGLVNPSGSMALGNSLVAGNSAGLLLDGQCTGATAGTRNVIEGSGSCGLSSTTNRMVEDARVGALADNGGPTETVALKKGSPAIKYGRNCPNRDQRGVKRPSPKKCDSGAFERTPVKPS